MEDRLKGLRESMKNTTFKQLNFTEEHRLQVHKKIHQKFESEEEIYIAVLQLLHAEKTGYELTQLLHSRGIQKIDGNEGFLYILLHRLNQKGVIDSSLDSSGDKYYKINHKGSKLLRKAEKSSKRKEFIFKELLQE